MKETYKIKRAVNFRPAVFLLGGQIFGIVFSYCAVTGNKTGAAVAAACAFCFCVFLTFFSAETKFAGKLVWLALFLLCAAAGYSSFKSIAKDYEKADLGGHVLTVSASVSEKAERDGYSVLLLNDVRFSGAINGQSYYGLSLTVYGENELKAGDRVEFTSVIRDRTLIFDGKFSATALAQKIKYRAEINAADVTTTDRSPDIFQKINLYIFDTLKAGLDVDRFPTAFAFLTGNTDFIAEETLSSYRAAGVAHIFAVSGLHIGFLATALYFLLGKLKSNKFLSFGITLALCVFYSGVCGFSASSLRAVIMFFFLNIARLVGLKYDVISSIAAAAFFILLFAPVQLFCAGFLLSFSVVASIAVLYYPLKKLFKFLPEKIAAALSASVAAELGGVPIMLAFFGEFASLSVFINLLFIPVAGVLFIMLFVGTIIGGLISPTVCLFLPDLLLLCVDAVIGATDMTVFLVGGFTLGGFAAAYYGAFIVAGGLINIKGAIKACLVSALALICVTGTWTITSAKYRQTYMTVMGSETLSAAFLHYKDEHALIISDISYRNFSLYALRRAAEITNGEGVAVAVLKQTKNYELTALVNRLQSVINIDKVYYFGEKREDSEKNVSAAFPFISAHNAGDGDGFYFGGGTCLFSLGGSCMAFERDGFAAIIFAAFSGEERENDLYISADLAVCYDNHEAVVRNFAPKKTVSFRKEYGFGDGETCGNLSFVLG